MLCFLMGLILGIFIGKFIVQILGLWRRTEKKIAQAIEETNKE